MLWLYKLQWEPVVFMDHIVGVMTLAAEKEDPDARDKAMSNGGLRTFLEDNDTMGYWKPCTLDTGHKETFITEIISFWVDRLLGFYHTPAVVPRYLDRSELKQLARTVAVRTVHRIIALSQYFTYRTHSYLRVLIKKTQTKKLLVKLIVLSISMTNYVVCTRFLSRLSKIEMMKT